MNSVNADNLGRIFTSVEDRQKLEKVRHTIAKKLEVLEVKEIEEPVEPEITKKELILRDPITLKGLVHRSDGKNTAWVNDSNTLEANSDTQLFQVPDNKIEPDQVTIVIPVDSNSVELRVGEVYVPEPIERDIVNTVNVEDDR